MTIHSITELYIYKDLILSHFKIIQGLWLSLSNDSPEFYLRWLFFFGLKYHWLSSFNYFCNVWALWDEDPVSSVSASHSACPRLVASAESRTKNFLLHSNYDSCCQCNVFFLVGVNFSAPLSESSELLNKVIVWRNITSLIWWAAHAEKKMLILCKWRYLRLNRNDKYLFWFSCHVLQRTIKMPYTFLLNAIFRCLYQWQYVAVKADCLMHSLSLNSEVSTKADWPL